jgi:hypothetical protein
MYDSKATDLDGLNNRGEQSGASEEAKFHLWNMKLPTIYTHNFSIYRLQDAVSSFYGAEAIL